MGLILNTDVSPRRDKALESSCLTQSRAVQDRAAALAPHLSIHPLQHSSLQTSLMAPGMAAPTWTQHLPPPNPPTKGSLRTEKRGLNCSFLLWLCPSLGRLCAWGKKKLLLPSGAGKVIRNCLCGSPTGAGHSACSIHSYSNHKAATPVACPRSAPTWDQHLDCKHSCRGKARDWGTGKSQGTSRAGWEQVAGSPVALEEPWSCVGARDQPPPSFPQPPSAFPRGGRCHSSPTLSQLLQLCSEGSMG